MPKRSDANNIAITDPGRTTSRKPTPEEWVILEGVAQDEGWDWVKEHVNLILAQAQMVGDL